MSEPVDISLPTSAPFPVVILAITCSPGQEVSKHQPLLKYKYWDYQPDPQSKLEHPPQIRVQMIGTFESPISGEISDIHVELGREVRHSLTSVCTIRAPCGHAVQYGGLCALCGASVEDEKDYTGFSYEDRATISMAHDQNNLRISYDEASRIERSSTQRLSEQRKLILVVDLDQTVIHATVDPTVGEWQRDPSNPNHRSVKDVQSFCLEEEPVPPPGWRGPKLTPTKCWYYVKVRPGLAEFLRTMSQYYEMHIYTMATRNYALAIAHIIDPEGEYFADRILSRDESGSLTHKNLKRLFPVDQSMVVIIDDRGDVWNWERNLIKVVPYDFFVGIGDINSSYLPKKSGVVLPSRRVRDEVRDEEDPAGSESGSQSTDTKTTLIPEGSEDTGEDREDNPESPGSESNSSSNDTSNDTSHSSSEEIGPNDSSPSPSPSPSPVNRMLQIAGGEDNKQLLLQQSRSRTLSLEQQQHDRPLAKLQHHLEKSHDHDPPPSSHSDSDDDDNLLLDNDSELPLLNTALVNVHHQYYSIFDQAATNPTTPPPDLATIIPQLKFQSLSGITVLFSGIIPLGVNLESAEIVIWCRQFGINVVNDIYPDVTHVVCRGPSDGKSGLTFKVRAARKLIPDVKIVSPDWIFACLSHWKKVDENDYVISEDDADWHVEEDDIQKYKRALEAKQERSGSITLEDYDLEDANQEVDDFLGEDSEDGEEENSEEDGEESDGDSDSNGDSNGDSNDRSRKRHYESGDLPSKKHKPDIDELEQELLDGFDEIE